MYFEWLIKYISGLLLRTGYMGCFDLLCLGCFDGLYEIKILVAWPIMLMGRKKNLHRLALKLGRKRILVGYKVGRK